MPLPNIDTGEEKKTLLMSPRAAHLPQAPYLIDKSLRTAVVIGEGFVNHQEHNAGEESEGQADKNGDLKEDRTERHTDSAHAPSGHTYSLPHLESRGWLVCREGESQAPRELNVSWLCH